VVVDLAEDILALMVVMELLATDQVVDQDKDRLADQELALVVMDILIHLLVVAVEALVAMRLVRMVLMVPKIAS
tara:strand:+ start:125 stop:346 length:222 start_codon:yes stop_codon:yes gene_type:complete